MVDRPQTHLWRALQRLHWQSEGWPVHSGKQKAAGCEITQAPASYCCYTKAGCWVLILKSLVSRLYNKNPAMTGSSSCFNQSISPSITPKIDSLAHLFALCGIEIWQLYLSLLVLVIRTLTCFCILEYITCCLAPHSSSRWTHKQNSFLLKTEIDYFPKFSVHIFASIDTSTVV